MRCRQCGGKGVLVNSAEILFEILVICFLIFFSSSDFYVFMSRNSPLYYDIDM